MKENLSIKKATVSIKVFRIDNHKMTKAVFRQIQEKKFYHLSSEKSNGFYYCKNCEILGYVHDETYWVVFIKNDCIYKCSPYLLASSWDINVIKKLMNNVVDKYDQIFIAT